MTADERLALIQIKIERAKKHISDLNREVGAFYATKPYETGLKNDPQSGKLSHYLIKLDPIPINFATIAGDAIHNLRSTLDHLAQHLWLVNNPSRPDAEFNFPICNSASKYKSVIDREEKSLRQDAIEAFRKVEAYKGGKGNHIWVLNRLDNIDKHRLILTIASAGGGLFVSDAFKAAFKDNPMLSNIVIPETLMFTPATPTILKVGDILGVVESEEDKNRKFPVHITFNEPQVFEGGPLLETLQHFADLVSNTVVLFKPCLA
jgi:hypothetical protein